MSLMRRRVVGSSCSIHGDNGCELSGEAEFRNRTQEKRLWKEEVRELLISTEDPGTIPDPR